MRKKCRNSSSQRNRTDSSQKSVIVMKAIIDSNNLQILLTGVYGIKMGKFPRENQSNSWPKVSIAIKAMHRYCMVCHDVDKRKKGNGRNSIDFP